MAPPVLGGAGLRRLGHFPCPCCRRLLSPPSAFPKLRRPYAPSPPAPSPPPISNFRILELGLQDFRTSGFQPRRLVPGFVPLPLRLPRVGALVRRTARRSPRRHLRLVSHRP